MIRVGPKNLLTDVPGIKVGNAEDQAVRSGVTVILPDEGVTAAVDVRGGAPGTRDIEALDPACLVGQIDAVVLSGGSAFGLDAAGGVMSWLAKRDRGFGVADAVVPLVPAAILFDLLNGGDKDWGEEPPYRQLGIEACDHAGEHFTLGNAGAGLGATVSTVTGPPIKGGLGSASCVFERQGAAALTVAALAAVNPFGSVLMPGSDVFWAWPFEQGAELGGRRPASHIDVAPSDGVSSGEIGGNTTLVVVATDAWLTKAEAKRIAIMAQDGIARAVHPAHTPFDGDTVFVLSTGVHDIDDEASDLATMGTLAADCAARAIARGVYEADDLDGLPSYRSLFPKA
ncbi:MAG: P1 family peptidase [Pseudomonadota bacterium]